MLIEWCCEKNSRLADWFVRHGHAALRLSLPEWDMRSEGRVDDALLLIVSAHNAGFAIALWIALPCTSLSAWQRINVRTTDACRQRVMKARAESFVLIRRLNEAIDFLKMVGIPAALAFEWPRGCSGWTEPL
eukprot:12183485-Heterocapsa_arctica.AAC.1